MLPAVIAVLRAYAPYITFPFAVVIGVIGYNLEGLVSGRNTPSKGTSVEEDRENRRLLEMGEKNGTEVESLKKRTFIPKSIFERNVSPSFQNEK